MVKSPATVELTEEMVNDLLAWNNAKQQLNAVKSDEVNKRLGLVKTLPWKKDKEEGGQTIALPGQTVGWKLSLNKTMDYKMENKDNAKVQAAVAALALVNPEAANTLITRWEPVMSEAVYKTLTKEEQIILADVVTVKPGMPQLEFKPPTAPKA